MFRTHLLTSILLLAALAPRPARSQENWTVVPPATLGEGSDCFSGLDGTSPNDVWAVGTWQNPYVYRSLIQHFDGTSWTKLPTPDTGNSEALRDVLAISAQSAIAVGYYIPSGFTGQPMVMEWNGSAWTLVAAPVFEGGGDFSAIDRSPAGTVWVSGYLYGTAFLARKSEGGWDIAYAPHVGGERNNFHDLDARSDTEIWAVGTWSQKQGQRMLLIQRYDGNGNWTSFDIPSPGAIDQFKAVRAFATTDVWAIGYYYDRTLYLNQPMIMHYDGVSWTRAQVPAYPGGSVRLESVTATAPDDIYAAGVYAPTGGIQGPFLLHYDGVSWSDVTLPPTGGINEWLLGMGSTPEGGVWVVGQYYDGTTIEPIAYRKAGTATTVGGTPGVERSLLSSFPNPFRYGTSVAFVLDQPGLVRLRVWDVAGRLVRTLAERDMPAGPRTVHWDGLDSHGRPVAAGVYFCDLHHNGRSLARQKMIRLR